MKRLLRSLFALVAGFAVWKFGVAAEQDGTLTISLVDGDSGKPTSARVELLDKERRSYAAEDALLVGDNSSTDPDPWQGDAAPKVRVWRKFRVPFTGTDHFYIDGRSQIKLPVGTYRLTVVKGPEFSMERREISVEAGKTAEAVVKLSRWIRPIEQGWYSADGHLHIVRPSKETDPALSRWMQAEDIHFANLLQWGHSKGFGNALQHTHGAAGVYREGDYFLASGQENPRTHFLGHAIILGAKSPIHVQDDYIVYKNFFEEAKRQGAMSGFAHKGKNFENGLDLSHGLLEFVEVLQFNEGKYTFWYDALTAGFRLTPTAGTDYMGHIVPGRERFYTRIEGAPTFESWLEGIRRGRTFVTNGPFLEFSVNGKGIGSDVSLDAPGSVLVEGVVRFDPLRDGVERLELVVNGEVAHVVLAEKGSAEIRCRLEREVKEGCWMALRSAGVKLGGVYQDRSVAHTAAIYVNVKGANGLSNQPRAKSLAQAWILRLEKLERHLTDENIDSLAKVGSDGVDLETLRKSRPALLKAIAEAKARFEERAR